MMKFIATITYISFILILNSVMVYVPEIPLFGQHFSLADGLVGIIYVVRDFAQRELRHRVLIAMLIGCGASYFLAGRDVALASVAAFFVGELIDWLVFTFTKKPLASRLLASSILSSPVDTYVFLAMINRLQIVPFIVVMLGKFIGIFAFYAVYQYREKSRQTAGLMVDAV